MITANAGPEHWEHVKGQPAALVGGAKEVFPAQSPAIWEWRQDRNLPDREAGGGRSFQAEEITCMKVHRDKIRFLF